MTLKPLHILIVEDSPANQEIVRIHLTEAGHTTDTANNGQEALDRLKENKYDAVFMDCHMPIMDGLEAVKRIRSNQIPNIDPQTYIIAITADSFKENRQKLLSEGMNDCIFKPFSLADIDLALLRNKTHQPPPISYTPDLIDIFTSEIRDNIIQLYKAIYQQAPDTLYQIAHTIEGTSANFGAKSMQNIALKIKRQAQHTPNNLKSSLLLIRQLEDNFQAFKEKLSKGQSSA